MKEFFGINKSLDKSNNTPDSEGHESLRLRGEAKAEFDSYVSSISCIEKRSALPVWLSIVKFVFGILAFASLIGLLNGLASTSFKKAWENASWAFIACGCCALVFITISVYGMIKKKNAADSPEAANVNDSLDELETVIARDLGIPERAAKVDVFSYSYKTKDNENKIYEQFSGHFLTSVCRVFSDAETLSLCMEDKRWDISKSSISAIEIDKRKYCTLNWTKDADINKEPFKEYKLYTDNLGRLWMKKSCRMYFSLDGEQFTLRFPIWELEVFEYMSGKYAKRD